MVKKFSSTQKLKYIEDETFKLGNKCAKSFEDDNSVHSLKATVMAYRCSMQSIRDQARYKIVKK